MLTIGSFCRDENYPPVHVLLFLGNRTAWILPFTAGGFIYVALVTVVPDLLKETNPRFVLFE